MKRPYTALQLPRFGLRVRRSVGYADMFWANHHIEGQFEKSDWISCLYLDEGYLQSEALSYCKQAHEASV